VKVGEVSAVPARIFIKKRGVFLWCRQDQITIRWIVQVLFVLLGEFISAWYLLFSQCIGLSAFSSPHGHYASLFLIIESYRN